MNKNHLICKLCVGALIENQAGEILLTKKTYGVFKDLWTLPEGYAAEEEMPPAALRRELKEELGVTAEISDLAAVRFRITGQENTAYFIFKAKVLNLDKMKADGRELAEIKFMKTADALADDKVYSLVKFILSEKNKKPGNVFELTDFLPTEIPASGGDYLLYL